MKTNNVTHNRTWLFRPYTQHLWTFDIRGSTREVYPNEEYCMFYTIPVCDYRSAV